MSTELRIENESQTFPNRRIILELKSSRWSKPILINDKGNLCSIRVNIKRNYGGIDPQANISVCNLDQSVMKDFTTQYFAPLNPDIISVYAGYENLNSTTTDLPRIFQGTILWATPTTGRPDIWFSMTCNETFFGLTEPIFFSVAGTDTPANIVKEAAFICGQRLGMDKPIYGVDTSRLDAFYEAFPDEKSKYEFPIDFFYYGGTLGNFLARQVTDWNGMSATIMNGNIILAPSSADYNRVVAKNPPQWTISAKDNAMIDIPYPNATGVDLTTLFNPKIAPLDTFELDSKIFPVFNRFKYWVQTVEYDLTTREQAFYNKITARRGSVL